MLNFLFSNSLSLGIAYAKKIKNSCLGKLLPNTVLDYQHELYILN